MSLDVRNDADVKSIIDATVSEFGAVHILANVAGVDVDQLMSDHPDSAWHRVIDVNLSGNFRTIKRCLPKMIEQGWGRIIIVGSTAASVGYRAHGAYCASKSGLLGLMRCVALEGAEHGVTCNVISPATVETGMSAKSFLRKSALSGGKVTVDDLRSRSLSNYPQKRFLEADEVASMALYLCRDEARGVTMENITIAGGAIW
jgi:NAD(P)-dependent dehydrogenase (short-subunit alcohol dehydrogenase family)